MFMVLIYTSIYLIKLLHPYPLYPPNMSSLPQSRLRALCDLRPLGRGGLMSGVCQVEEAVL